MFIIPVVPSSSMSSVSFLDAFFSFKHMSSRLTTTLHTIFCYKFYYDFFLWHVNYMWNLYWYIYIYFPMWKWYSIYISYISDNFFNMSRWIFFYKCIFMQFFNHFSPPDVASVIVPIVHIVSDVVSVSVTVPDGGVHNTVGLVFIFVSGVCVHTLLWYFIPNYMLLSFYIISTYNMYFYIFIYFSHIYDFFFIHQYEYFAIHIFLQDFSVSFVYLI